MLLSHLDSVSNWMSWIILIEDSRQTIECEGCTDWLQLEYSLRILIFTLPSRSWFNQSGQLLLARGETKMNSTMLKCNILWIFDSQRIVLNAVNLVVDFPRSCWVKILIIISFRCRSVSCYQTNCMWAILAATDLTLSSACVKSDGCMLGLEFLLLFCLWPPLAGCRTQK